MAKKGQPIYTEILNFYLYTICVQPKKKKNMDKCHRNKETISK